ncbi:hypothetical protein ACFX1X_044091 [Malus domestica]
MGMVIIWECQKLALCQICCGPASLGWLQCTGRPCSHWEGCKPLGRGSEVSLVAKTVGFGPKQAWVAGPAKGWPKCVCSKVQPKVGFCFGLEQRKPNSASAAGKRVVGGPGHTQARPSKQKLAASGSGHENTRPSSKWLLVLGQRRKRQSPAWLHAR